MGQQWDASEFGLDLVGAIVQSGRLIRTCSKSIFLRIAIPHAAEPLAHAVSFPSAPTIDIYL